MADDAADALTLSLDLFRRLPPHNVASNLLLLCDCMPDLADDLLASVDQPLGVKLDKNGASREYLTCDYNRDGDSYRSSWTNTYDPPLADGTAPSPQLRQLEQKMNDAFDIYRDLYYEGGVSSVYLWDTEDNGFAGVVLLKKETKEGATTASWDSIHVFEALERGRQASYKLTSTVMLYLVKPLSATAPAGTATSGPEVAPAGDVRLGGSMTRQTELTGPFEPSNTSSSSSSSSSSRGHDSHVENVGKMVEDMEGKMRNSLQEVYFSKTKDITQTLRSSAGFGEQNKMRMLQGELVGLLKGRKQAV